MSTPYPSPRDDKNSFDQDASARPQPARYGSYEQPQQFPVCARHPENVSYARCGRCNRPACGQCQIPLEVGMICADCYRTATGKDYRREQKKARGGAWANYPVTIVLIALTVAIYALQVILPGQAVINALAYNSMYVSYTGEWWRMLTAGFVHSQSNIAHVGMNMFTLWMFGQALEPIMGKWKYLITYLLSIIGGSVAVMLLAPGTWVVGASGGIFGLFAAYFVVNKLHGGETRSIVSLIAVNFAFGLFVSGISWQGHLGGLIAGAIVAYLLQMTSKDARRR